MLVLHGKIKSLGASKRSESLLTITTNTSLPSAIRHRYALLSSEDVVAVGYGALLLRGDAKAGGADDVYHLPDDFSYLRNGDIVSIDPIRQILHVLFRKASSYNT